VPSTSHDRFMTRSAGSRLPPEVRARVESLHLGGWSLRAIERELVREGTAVAYNTIRAIAAELDAERDPSGPWRLEAPEGIGSRRPDVVIEVLAGVLHVKEGRVRSPTRRVADWIAALRTAAPWLSPWSCYMLARRYVAFEVQNRDTAELDQVLVMIRLGDATTSRASDDHDLAVLVRQLTWAQSVTASGIGLRIHEGASQTRE
jgi:hypothetical protein